MAELVRLADCGGNVVGVAGAERTEAWVAGGECYVTEIKKCMMCNEEKPTTDFHANKSFPDGLNHTCKLCWNDYMYKRRKQIEYGMEDFGCLYLLKYNDPWYLERGKDVYKIGYTRNENIRVNDVTRYFAHQTAEVVFVDVCGGMAIHIEGMVKQKYKSCLVSSSSTEVFLLDLEQGEELEEWVNKLAEVSKESPLST